MSTKFRGQAYGPGFPGAGAPVEFTANEQGIRVGTPEADDGAPRWGDITLHEAGWDGRQLRLEWKRDAGVYAVTVGEADAKALRQLAANQGATRQRSGNRAASRLVLLIILVAVGLPLALLGALVWQHDRIAAWAVSHIPVEQEARLGEILFEQQKAQLKPVQGPALDMVRGIGERLTKGSAYRYQFHVTEDASVNAFAMPGGYVVVNTGLLKLAATPEEVAGVLAHEVQHVEQRHSLRGMAQSLGLVTLLHLAVGDVGGLASLGGNLVNLKFSRDHESEADREGLKALVAAGINPTGMRDFFAKMSEQSKIELGFLSSHPASTERMAEMGKMIEALPEAARRVPGLGYDYGAIKAGLGKLH